ncbi:TetR/AcrR family transcriptional regulator [Pseudonocardiaceae bacterium YIM PH 21723]|nr:TetR/AcrR family transcriptional regulator [Pseudonocardiaceae bacterium YIM PH 21723]
MVYRRTEAIQQRLDAQRETVLDAAERLLSEQGYAGCTMAAVAAKAGVATGTVYKHFATKSELATELFRQVCTREVNAVAKAAAVPGTLTERVTTVVEAGVGRAMKAPRRAYALLAEPVDPGVEAERLKFRRAFRDVIASVITEGVAGGILPPQDPQLTAAALIGAIAEAMVGPLAEGTAQPDFLPNMVTFAIRAIGGSDAPHS